MYCCTETRGKQHCEAGGGRIAAEQGLPGVLNSYLTASPTMRNWRCELRREAVKEVPISGVSVTNHSTTAIPKASAWKPRLDEPLAGQCKVLARLCHFRPTILSSLVHLQEFLAILILFLC